MSKEYSLKSEEQIGKEIVARRLGGPGSGNKGHGGLDNVWGGSSSSGGGGSAKKEKIKTDTFKKGDSVIVRDTIAGKVVDSTDKYGATYVSYISDTTGKKVTRRMEKGDVKKSEKGKVPSVSAIKTAIKESGVPVHGTDFNVPNDARDEINIKYGSWVSSSDQKKIETNLKKIGFKTFYTRGGLKN